MTAEEETPEDPELVELESPDEVDPDDPESPEEVDPDALESAELESALDAELVLGAEEAASVCWWAVAVVELLELVDPAEPDELAVPDVPDADELEGETTELEEPWFALALDAASAMIAPAPSRDPAATEMFTRRRRRRPAFRCAWASSMAVKSHPLY